MSTRCYGVEITQADAHEYLFSDISTVAISSQLAYADRQG